MIKKAIVVLLCAVFSPAMLPAQEDLIPYPREVKKTAGALDLQGGIHWVRTDVRLDGEYRLAAGILKEWGISVQESGQQNPVLALRWVDARPDLPREAYQLKIDPAGITISASSSTGIFYGLQTLRQFQVTKQKLPFCDINDAPAFSWRGFLVDVGRNYQPLEMLKEQVEAMARYKLNVFHFHFTEDIAWRLVSKKYPGLTAGSNMTRWPGKFYTEEDFRELIRFCAERHILLLPEIDMPGHSDAFKRYFGADMQSEEGITYIKELLREFSETYPGLPYLHIGGDEVKIINPRFMPEITGFVEKLGYKTVGWDPGSNLQPQTVRQLWMGGPKPVEEKGELVFIDSKHLYINHMDPLETVVTLFHRKIGEQDKEHSRLLGATLCAWPDRAVSAPEDMFYQNAVYPAILAFGERSWRGGGEAGWTARIFPHGTTAYDDFADFENRLLQHKKRYFNDKPFPYVKQTGLHWELIGPLDNGGDVSREFPVEKKPFSRRLKASLKAEGGTLILRHWWAELIQGVVTKPGPNTTWYARTRIWSETEGLQPFWIGFNDLSRSYTSSSPQKGTWDGRGSKVWVNGGEIAPPEWKQPGIKGAPEIPLADEGYTYREPTLIRLKKGWNEVLIKAPVKDFKGTDWANPVKWMFTFVPVTE